MNRIQQKIQTILEQQGKTIAQLAQDAGVSPNIIYVIKSRVCGGKPVSPRSRFMLAKVLQTTVEDLFG